MERNKAFIFWKIKFQSRFIPNFFIFFICLTPSQRKWNISGPVWPRTKAELSWSPSQWRSETVLSGCSPRSGLSPTQTWPSCHNSQYILITLTDWPGHFRAACCLQTGNSLMIADWQTDRSPQEKDWSAGPVNVSRQDEDINNWDQWGGR